MSRIILSLSILVFVFTAGNIRAQCSMKGGHKHAGQSAQHGGHSSTATAERAVATLVSDNLQTAAVVVKNGYTPATIVARKGIPLQLSFDLQEESCTGTVIFKELNVRKELTPFSVTIVELTPNATGSFAFSCPMNMIHGTLIVEDPDKVAQQH